MLRRVALVRTDISEEPQGRVRPEGLGNLIKIIHFIGPRTRDLLVCNIAP
jgi:hypothetical protein